jgi:aldose 1-epimerase
MSKKLMIDGKEVAMFTLKNRHGMWAEITNFGAKVVRLYVADRNGKFDDVVLGFDTLEEVVSKEEYFGATCGRFANRIKDGKFTIDRKEYTLAVNNGTNALHGGVDAFNTKVWDVVLAEEQTLTLKLVSPDGEEGYPGELTVFLTYSVTDDNELSIHYEATTTKPTVVGLTNHSYFNLKGAGNGTVRDHILQINADFVTLLDESFSPSGEIVSVEGTAFDFREPTLIGDRIDHEVYAPGRGLDNNWCLRKHQQGDGVLAGYIYEPTTGRKMEVITTQPGMQVYTANWVDKQVAKDGKTYESQHSICLETQGFPNSPNIAHFPSPVIRPGESYNECCLYRFSVE